MSEATQLLHAITAGDPNAAENLLPVVYQELRNLARLRMAQERPEHTLQATALVHEAYLRLVGNDPSCWANRAHFFHAAAEAMRRILIEHARGKSGPKRGGGRKRLPLNLVDLAAENDPAQILALDEAISRLEKQDPDAARVLRLRFYAGLSVDEVAQIVGASPRTVKRDWAFARAFLIRELGES
jgi:RNA polymerase sigma factor (TIGR02999 family)